jgi:hypothetical protein
LTSSLDWEIKLWKPNFTKFVTLAKHDDFITSIDVNNAQNPFVVASADSEGTLMVNKYCNGSQGKNIFKWNAEVPI